MGSSNSYNLPCNFERIIDGKYEKYEEMTAFQSKKWEVADTPCGQQMDGGLYDSHKMLATPANRR
jgi:hypothetical protein